VAITPEKQDEATRLATSFLSIQTPINTRLAAVKSETFAGIYVFPQPGHVKPLYMVTEAHFNDDDGLPYDVFVAQATNNKDNIILESFRCDVHLNFVVAVPEGDCPSEATWKNNSGSLFTKADLATWPASKLASQTGSKSTVLLLFRSAYRFSLGHRKFTVVQSTTPAWTSWRKTSMAQASGGGGPSSIGIKRFRVNSPPSLRLITSAFEEN
jgi:hypothetical protein